jgi:hypothetical protein
VAIHGCRSRCSPSSWVSQPSGSTTGGREGNGGKWGKAVSGGRLPHEKARARSLPIGVLHKGLGDGSGLLEGAGVIKGEALLVLAAMIAFDKGVLLRVMGITDLDVDAQTGSEVQESRGKIAALLGCLPSGNPDLR